MLYREGEVNCGHCREPQGTAVDDYIGETYEDGEVTFTREPCMRCRVHDLGTEERCDDDCPDCEGRGDEPAGGGVSPQPRTRRNREIGSEEPR